MIAAAAMPSAFQTPASMAACSTPTASGPWASALGTSTRARVMRRTPRRGSMHLIMAAAAIKALMEWHTASADAVLAELKTSRSGLSGSEARLRLARYGPNELPQQPPVPAWRIFGRPFAHLLAALFIVAAPGEGGAAPARALRPERAAPAASGPGLAHLRPPVREPARGHLDRRRCREPARARGRPVGCCGHPGDRNPECGLWLRAGVPRGAHGGGAQEAGRAHDHRAPGREAARDPRQGARARGGGAPGGGRADSP